MIALAPLAVAPLAALWVAADVDPAILLPSQITGGEAVWLAEIGVAPRRSASSLPAPFGMMAGLPLATAEHPADVSGVAEVYVSDRGWIGEPNDGTYPDRAYPPRLIEPPVLEQVLPLLPEERRRVTASYGELRLANGDGRLDTLAANWSLGGREVRLLRGAHLRPIHADYAEMVQIARLRVARAASGGAVLSIALTDAAADLAVPACETYGGTGGEDGVASLAGQPKPRLYGIKRQIEPVLEDTARGIYRLHHGAAISAVSAVRDRGVPYTFGTDRATYADLQANTPSAGYYDTCLAEGCIRVEPAGSAGIKALTVDAQGDVGSLGYSSGTSASIATKLLTGPGGLSSADIAPGAFGDWPVGEAGLYLRGGTVAEAMDRLVAGIAGWWGADRDGLITGSRLARPEDVAPAWDIQPWMLRAPPEEVADTAAPPRWRVTVAYQVLGKVLTGEDLADSVSASDREVWSKPARTVVEADTDISAAYPLAVDAPALESVLDGSTDAAALATYLFALHSRPRRTWQVLLNRAGLAMQLGQAVRLTWPRHGLAAGRTMMVRQITTRGDRTEALLWG